MRSCEATGKNIEQAISNALFELKAAREDVDIKILSQGGFLKKAKVQVTISEDALEKYEKKDKLKAEEAAATEAKVEVRSKQEQVDDGDFAEKFMSKKVEMSAPKSSSKVKVIADEEYVSVTKKQSKNEDVSATKPENAERAKRQPRERKLSGEEFLEGVLSALELDGQIEKTEDEQFVRYNLTGENLNDLIGHHGDCLSALSYVMSLVCKADDHKKIVLDIEGYRGKREESLKTLAKRIADKVAKSGRYYKLEPMPANERRIMHLALQDDDRVTTLSKGTEPNRYLIVFPKEYKE